MAEARRYLCSHLISLHTGEAELRANLEEIWPEGAILECEQPVEPGAHSELRCDRLMYAGKVTEVTRHEFGWRVEIEFSPLTPWSLASFQPAHLFPLGEP